MSIDCWSWQFEGDGAQELNELLQNLRDKARFIVNARKVNEEARRRTGGLGAEEAKLKDELLKQRAVVVEAAKDTVRALEEATKIEEEWSLMTAKIESFLSALGAVKATVVSKQSELEELQNRGESKNIS